MGIPKTGKPVPGQNGSLSEKILKVLVDNDCVFSAVAHEKLATDILTLGWDRVKYLANNFSPSQLGRMGHLGVRRLAQLKRDNPQKFRKVMVELEAVV